MAPFRRPRLAAPTPESTAWTLLSTWAQQRHLPPIDPSLNGEQVRKGTILGKFELTRKLGGGPCANPARHLFLPVDAPAGEGEFAQVYECVKREDRARRFAWFSTSRSIIGTCPMWLICNGCFKAQPPLTSRSTLLGTTKSQNRNDRLDFFWSGDLAIW